MAARLSTVAAAAAGVAASFDLSPFKIAVCHLIQVFSPPSQSAIPVPFRSVSHHNRLGLFLFSITRSCEYFIEPSFDELIHQLKGMGGSAGDWFSEWLGQHLTECLGSFDSPDDLFTFFDKLRAVLLSMSGIDYSDDRTILDPNSHLGYFLRCCILSFSMLSYEGVCHLLTKVGAYCNSADSAYEVLEDEYARESELTGFFDEASLNKASYERGLETKSTCLSNEIFSFHIQMPKCLYDVAEDIGASVDHKFGREEYQSEFISRNSNASREGDYQGGSYLRSKWQVLGYMNEQADLLEKHFTLCSSSSFDSILKQLQKMAPELHRVKYLQYLNNFYHNNYVGALDNLHYYFDCSGGIESIANGSQVSFMFDPDQGRYQLALLCLGIMYCHFGLAKPSLEALTDAVRVAQVKNDNSCLAYTLAAICDLLSDIGTPSTTGIIGSPYSSGTSMGLSMPLSTQQQLLVLLRSAIKWAETLKLTRLVAFNRLLLAKFDMKNVRGPLASFGPKDQTTLKTSPISVCKELRLSSFLYSNFGLSAISNDSGTFSTSWLKNMQHARSSSVSAHLPNTNDYDAFSCSLQPNPIPDSALQVVGASYLLKATSWELYGSAPLARMNTLTQVICLADVASSIELSLAHANLIKYLTAVNGYRASFSVLRLADQKFPFPKSQVHLLKLQLLHERALHKGHLISAQRTCEELSMSSSSLAGVDMELKTEASLCHARTLLAANHFSEAATIAHSVFGTCYEYNLHIERAVVLLLLAEIHKKSDNPVLGLRYALASLSFCQSLNLDLLEASATLTIAELWLCLGPSHSKRALCLVYRCLPMILGHGRLELRARANIAVAKCIMSDPNFSVSKCPDLLDSLKQAAKELEILEYHEMAAEAFYLMAIVYNMLDQFEEREHAATSFKKHIIALENPIDQEINDWTGSEIGSPVCV